jgi:hypothetical protein
MTTEHEKLVEDCARAIWRDVERHGDPERVERQREDHGWPMYAGQARAALAIAVERCVVLCEGKARLARKCGDSGWQYDEIAAAIRALLSPNDRGQA